MSLFEQIAALNPGVVPAVVALAGAIGAVTAALITAVIGKFMVTPFLGARDKQDRETEWRKHAIELTKLDLERRLKTREPTDKSRLRPSILDFLANYRDLQELGSTTPKQLYETIIRQRISTPAPPVAQPGLPKRLIGGLLRLFDHNYH